MRVATYVRVSTEEQVQHGSSLDAQAEICRARALKLGATELVQFVDAGISGGAMDRPALQEMLSAAARREIDAVVCLDPDRLARNLAHQLIITDQLEAQGVELHFVQFERARTPDGRLLYAIRGAIAEFEAHKIRERTIQGKRQRLREGRVVTGTRIYGYAYDQGHHRFLEDPAEAAVVRAIFRMAELAGTRAIAEALNRGGLKAKGGGNFNQSTVYGILRNPSYLGRMSQLRGLGTVRLPPLVDRATFTAAQAALAGRRRSREGAGRRVYLLSGLAVCAACGRHVTGCGGSRAYYGCTGKRAQPPCSAPYYPAEQLEAGVWAKVAGALLGAWPAHEAALPPPSGGNRRVERERRRLARQRDRLLQTGAAGRLTAEDLAGALEQVAARQRALALEKPCGDGGPPREALARLLATGDPALRRRILRALHARIVLGPGTAEIHFDAPSARRPDGGSR